MEDGCDFALIVWVHMSVRIHVCVCACVYPQGVEGASGISRSYADFTGTAGIVCTIVRVHMSA